MIKIKKLYSLLVRYEFSKIFLLIFDHLPKIVLLSNNSYKSITNILKGYRHAESFSFSSPKEVIPWMTYPIIDFIKNIDLKEKSVFEYGSGYSTVFWAKAACKITSIENDKLWFERISKSIPENVTLLLRDQHEAFINSINEGNETYDIIVLDGYGFRYECALTSIAKLNPGGMVILDDSDNIAYKRICDFLKSNGLIQVDFVGLKPGLERITATSVFMKRDFNFHQKYDLVQPRIFVGNQRNYQA